MDGRFGQSHLQPGSRKSPLRALLSVDADSLLTALHERAWPSSLSRRGQGLSEYLRRRRNLQCTSSMPSHFPCFMATKDPSTSSVATEPTSRRCSGEWAQLGLLRCRKPCFCLQTVVCRACRGRWIQVK